MLKDHDMEENTIEHMVKHSNNIKDKTATDIRRGDVQCFETVTRIKRAFEHTNNTDDKTATDITH